MITITTNNALAQITCLIFPSISIALVSDKNFLKCRHLPVVDEGVHEDLLLDDLLELWLLVDEVAVVVVAHHDCVRLRRQVQDELVVVADDAPPAHLPRRRERQQPLALQLRQQVLVCKTKGSNESSSM